MLCSDLLFAEVPSLEGLLVWRLAQRLARPYVIEMRGEGILNAAYLRVGLDGCDKGSGYLLPWPIGRSAGRRCGAGRDKLDFAAIDPGADAGDQSCV